MVTTANASPLHWTTYDYDAMGRTLRVTPPGNAGSTTYEYGGTTVKTIDPKGKWKKFENDALGNLVRVWEPRPGGGPDFETLYACTIFGKLSTVTLTRPGKGMNPATSHRSPVCSPGTRRDRRKPAPPLPMGNLKFKTRKSTPQVL